MTRISGTRSLVLNWISLRFVDKEVERRFLHEHLVQSLPIIRLALLAGTTLYAVFGILDAYIFPDVYPQIWVIRYGFITPILLAIFVFTFTPQFIPGAQAALSLAMGSAGVGIVGMTAIGTPPGNHWYYAGLIMVVIYCSSMIRLHHTYSLAISVFLCLLYQVSAVSVNPVPGSVLINNDFFLVMATAVGALVNYVEEYYIRCHYVSTQLVLREKERSDDLFRKANAANQAKTEFLANVSHELRTPLNAIMGFSEMMKGEMFGPLGSEHYRSYADDIYQSGGHLLNIINDILDLSKAEAGKLTLNEETIDPCEIIDGCLRMFRDQAVAQGVRLSFDVPGDRFHLRADPRLVRQVVINLVSNAIKFTQLGGSVDVAVALDHDGGCLVSVTDTGIGIGDDDLARVTEPFVQVESAYSREHAGTGLGLPLVQKIMELHGGRLELQSTLGAGTTVAVHFPAERVERAADEARTLRVGLSA